jgi:ankyrin repeat protein
MECRKARTIWLSIKETNALFWHRFRWAYCQLHALKKLKSTSPKYVKKALDDLPATLDDMYMRVLLDIEEMYHDHALTLLRWLAYARSPPSLGELVDAAVTDPIHESCIDADNRGDLEDTLNILSELVTVDGSQVTQMESCSMIKSHMFSDLTTGHVQAEVAPCNPHLTSNTRLRLAHFSVKEYLESKRILTSDARHFSLDGTMGHKHLAQSCLTYLGYYSASNKKTSTKSDLSVFPLLEYAAQSWPYHSRLQHHDGVCRETSFLRSEQARNDWLLVHKPDRSWLSPFEESESSGNPGGALYYASLLGLPAVVSNLLDGGANSNVCGGRFGNPLSAASSRGHQAVVHLLLNNHALVNAQGGHLANALQAASSAGCAEVVRLLLVKGARVNAQSGHFGNALQVASFRGFLKVVQLLLSEGAAVDIQSGHFNTAIRAAALGGHIKVVQLLLDNGADIRQNSTESGSALEAASFGGREEIVQLLLEGGADPNARGGMFDNCLFAALGRGHTKVAHLLLEVGADIHAIGQRHGNALQAASFGGCLQMVQLLLDRGAIVNACNGQRGYALQAASCRGFKNVVQLLLDEGAEVNAKDGDCRTALQAASSCGHHDVVLILLDRGADVNACGNYGSALYLASQEGHVRIARLLIDRGAHVNSISGYHNTALQAALSGGHANVVGLLRASGASETNEECG